MAGTVPDGPEASRKGEEEEVTCLERRILFERGEKKQTVINGDTPKLESCHWVSVSLYDVAPEEPRVHDVWSCPRYLFRMPSLIFVFFFSGLLMRQGAFGSGWKLPCGGEHILPPQAPAISPNGLPGMQMWNTPDPPDPPDQRCNALFPEFILPWLGVLGFWGFFFFSFFTLTLPEKPVKITSMNEHDHHHLFPASQAGPIPLHKHYLVYASCQRQ